MINRFESLNSLFDVEAGNNSVVSIYLDARANETGKKTFDVFLKKQISEHRDHFLADSEEKKKNSKPTQIGFSLISTS